MPIRSSRDVANAFREGRWHTQRFTKAAGQTGDGVWQDWAYAGGQPAFDARIGTALALNPVVATRNDAIWFPPIGAGEERHLAGIRLYPTASGADQLNVEYQMYDLLAVYPLIDGDSTDTQVMDNTLTLPRYADGVGVFAILVNHISPGLSSAAFTINYTNANDTARVMTGTTTTAGVGKAAHAISGATSGAALFTSMDARCRGIKSITDITFATAPGGLWCIYLVRPICTAHSRAGGAGVTRTMFTEMCFCREKAFELPRIYDGAHLGFFYMPNGGTRTVTTYGDATFIWK